MYKVERRVYFGIINVVVCIAFLLLSLFLVPEGSNLFIMIMVTVIYIVLQYLGVLVSRRIDAKLEVKCFHKKSTGIITTFIERLHYCYTLDDFFSAIIDILEMKGDCSVLFIDSETKYVIYNSSSKLTSTPNLIATIQEHFTSSFKDGYYFLDSSFGLSSKISTARGFFLVKGKYQFYVFCNYTHLFDTGVYMRLYEELERFLTRQRIINNLTEITELSREWAMLADVQKSFLPEFMPEVAHLDLAVYFRPLVNVSGDYYTVLPLDEDKTLLMLGDVSGKGLAAALVMGLVVNTVKTAENKEDLVSVIHAVDESIKGMQLQDKYTVMFIGIVDTKKMTIRYVNASISDPVIVTKSPTGYRIKSLSSNCSVVGIIDLDDIVVEERKLFHGDLIFMASDGISEAINDQGIELSDTPLLTNTIKNSAYKSAKDFVDDVSSLVLTYSGEQKLRDDITMLVAKVEG